MEMGIKTRGRPRVPAGLRELIVMIAIWGKERIATELLITLGRAEPLSYLTLSSHSLVKKDLQARAFPFFRVPGSG